MSIFKRGSVYWYHFLFNGEHIQKSTKQGNPRTARQIEAAHKTALARGEVGLVERPVAPLFSGLAVRFISHLESRHENKPRTIDFYASKMKHLVAFPAIGKARIDRIDESVIETYVVARRALVCPATVNRELATLRRMLRLAHEWKELQRVPKIKLLSGERMRDFVLTRKQEATYLAACPQPLRDIALVMLETGMRIGEALSLEWEDVTLEPVQGARFGFIRIRDGKSKNARRIIPLTDRAGKTLEDRQAGMANEASGARADYPEGNREPVQFVFANRTGGRYLVTSMNHLHRNVAAPKVDGKRVPIFPGDFVMHSLRHTMLTRLGEAGVDAFTIMRIAGHSSVVVSQRYIHPTPEAVERAFERLQLSSNVVPIQSKRQPPATLPATLPEVRVASC